MLVLVIIFAARFQQLTKLTLGRQLPTPMRFNRQKGILTKELVKEIVKKTYKFAAGIILALV